MATVIASDAKLVVNLDTTDAEAKAAKLAAMLPGGGIQQPTAGGSGPRQPRQPNSGGDGARTVADTAEDTFDALKHAKAVARAAMGGDLYGASVQTAEAGINASPIGGPQVAAAFAVAAFTQKFGVTAMAAQDAMIDDLPEPFRSALKASTEFTNMNMKALITVMNEVEVRLNAISATVDNLKEAAVVGGGLGGMEPSEFEAYGLHMYDVNKFFGDIDKARKVRNDLWLGEQIGHEPRSILSRIFGGGSGR